MFLYVNNYKHEDVGNPRMYTTNFSLNLYQYWWEISTEINESYSY
jgi:hypothetical protein